MQLYKRLSLDKREREREGEREGEASVARIPINEVYFVSKHVKNSNQ